MRHAVLDSPIGSLTLTGEEDGATLTGLYMHEHLYAPAVPAGSTRDDTAFAAAREQLDGYFAGERTAFDLRLRLAGTPFQRAVWTALLEVPHGRTVSYGEIARRIGRPAAVRAVGLANGRNPISIVVPCHRVIGASGALTGYGGGLERKRWLLAHEAGRPAMAL